MLPATTSTPQSWFMPWQRDVATVRLRRVLQDAWHWSPDGGRHNHLSTCTASTPTACTYSDLVTFIHVLYTHTHTHSLPVRRLRQRKECQSARKRWRVMCLSCLWPFWVVHMISLREEGTVGRLSPYPASLKRPRTQPICILGSTCFLLSSNFLGYKRAAEWLENLFLSCLLPFFLQSASSNSLKHTHAHTRTHTHARAHTHTHTHTHRGHRELQVSIHASHYRGMSVFYEAV